MNSHSFHFDVLLSLSLTHSLSNGILVSSLNRATLNDLMLNYMLHEFQSTMVWILFFSFFLTLLFMLRTHCVLHRIYWNPDKNHVVQFYLNEFWWTPKLIYHIENDSQLNEIGLFGWKIDIFFSGKHCMFVLFFLGYPFHDRLWWIRNGERRRKKHLVIDCELEKVISLFST